jgi:hypothetical protein
MFNLNKENFFDDIKAKYPQAFEHFMNWLDDYKKEIRWDELFAKNARLSVKSSDDIYPDTIKFHDLPFDMQNGILARFDIEKFSGKLGYESMLKTEPRRMENLFAAVQTAIENKNIKLN